MRTTRTNVSGIDICDLMPRQAQNMDKLSIVRSMSHATGDHFVARAEGQAIREIPIPAARGDILDEQGRVLVETRYAQVVSVNGLPNTSAPVARSST